MQDGLKVTFKSNPLEVRNALATLLGCLDGNDVLPEERGTVELVLAEVMNNIVEHAYLEDPSGDIEVDMVRTDRGITCNVLDFGHPMPDGRTPLGAAPSMDVETDDLPEGGFGWFLIAELAKDLTYQRQGDANHFGFRMAVGAL